MKISELMVRIGYDGDRAERGLRRLRDDLGRTEHQGGAFSRGLSSSFRGLATVGIGAAAGIGAGFGAMLGFGTKVAADTEVAQVSFEVLLGSAQEADAFLKQLGDFAATTPFEFPELRESASRLLAAGTAADDVIPIMTALGDATSAMGTGAEGIDRAVMALNQMRVKGKVTGEEMLQLAEAGVPAWDALAAKLGVDVAQAQEMVSSGQVRVNDLMGAIADKAGPAFARVDGMMARQSTTLTGLWSTFKDTMSMKLGDAAAPVVESLKAALPGLTETFSGLLTTLAPVISSLGTQLGPTIEALMPMIQAGAPIVAQLATIFAEKFGPVMDQLAPIITVLAEQLGDLLGEALDALVPILDELAPYLTDVIEQMGGAFMEALVELTPELIELMKAITPLIPPLMELATGVITDLLVPALNTLIPLIAGFVRGIQDTGENFRAGLERIKASWAVFEDKLRAGVDRIKAFFTSLGEKWDAQVQRLRDGVDRVQAFFAGLAARISAAADAFIARVQQLGTDFIAWVTGLPGRVAGALGNLTTTLVGKGRDLMAGLSNGVTARWADLSSWLTGIPGRIATAVGNLGSKLYQAGRDLISGFIDGIKARWDDLTGWISGAASHLPGFIKDPLGIESPSRVFRDLGLNVGEGLRLGLASSMGDVERTMAGFAPKIVAPMGAASRPASMATRPAPSGGGGRGGDTYISIGAVYTKARTAKELVADLREYQRGNGPLPIAVTG